MRHLTIKNFSCIKEASLDLGRLTILIGPQASGKSVICKLSHFLFETLKYQSEFIWKGASLDVFKEGIATTFCEWFPPSAWGEKKFSIEFRAGAYHISITHPEHGKKNSAHLKIKLSDAFEKQYVEMRDQVAKHNVAISRSPGVDIVDFWQTRNITNKSSEVLLDKDYLNSQLFIPAGRSFFTSIGKTLATFAQNQNLDPLILPFGQFFTQCKERRNDHVQDDNTRPRTSIQASFAHILGGTLITGGDQDMVECADGRRIPFTALSSGQQELLPLAVVLPELAVTGIRQCIYIEEPEAHLFPSAQSMLVEIFANIINFTGIGPDAGADLVLTTHSPYVLVKINNLIKAGQLGRSDSEAQQAKVQSIISKDAWLGSDTVQAYAIRDGHLENIIDTDGLINGDYLDDVSGDISKEFMRLLEIEIENGIEIEP